METSSWHFSSSLNLVESAMASITGLVNYGQEEVASSDGRTSSKIHLVREEQGPCSADRPRDSGVIELETTLPSYPQSGSEIRSFKISPRFITSEIHSFERILFAVISFPKPASLPSSNYSAPTVYTYYVPWVSKAGRHVLLLLTAFTF